MDVKTSADVPERGKRFAHPAWGKNPAFFAVRQGYLAVSQSASGLLAAGADGPADDARARLATGFPLAAPTSASSARPARRPGTKRPATQALIPGGLARFGHQTPRLAAEGPDDVTRPRAGERVRPPARGSRRHQAIADATGQNMPG